MSFSVIVWIGNCNRAERHKLGWFVRVADKVIGVKQSPLRDLYDSRVIRRALVILDCDDHPLYREFVLLPSGRRYRVPTHRTKHYKLFVWSVVNILNLL